jgi:branched-chain amino acid transport system substrate-binding protein
LEKRNGMKRLLLAVFIIYCAGSMVFAAGGKDANTIVIGGIFPLSGPEAVYGVEARNGIELAIEEINAAGGINGKQLALVSEDDTGNPEISVNAYRKLTAQDKVNVIIGSLTSGCTIAITSLAQAQKVVLVAPAATAEEVTDAGDFIFRACFIDPFQGTVGALSRPMSYRPARRRYSTITVTTIRWGSRTTLSPLSGKRGEPLWPMNPISPGTWTLTPS